MGGMINTKTKLAESEELFKESTKAMQKFIFQDIKKELYAHSYDQFQHDERTTAASTCVE